MLFFSCYPLNKYQLYNFVLLVIVIVLVVIYCLWKRNRIRIEELITPSEDDKVSEESIKTTDGMFFNICVLSKDGEQDNIGKLQFLPSSRLREIRNSLLDSFPEHFEKKAFCFLTKQGEQVILYSNALVQWFPTIGFGNYYICISI